MGKNYHNMYKSSLKEVDEPTQVEEVVEEEVLTDNEDVVEEPIVEPEPVVEEPIPEPEPVVKKRTGHLYNTERLNIRKAPNGEVLGVMDNKQSVVIIDDSDPDWYEISAPIKGFVMKKFIAE